jgi:hypothetical protein
MNLVVIAVAPVACSEGVTLIVDITSAERDALRLSREIEERG